MNALVYGALNKLEESGAGHVSSTVGDVTERYGFDQNNRDNSTIVTSSAYYKHSFETKGDLEVRAAYNYNHNDLDIERHDLFGEEWSSSPAAYRNYRNSLTLQADYSRYFPNGAYLAAGMGSDLRLDKIDRREPSSPLFRHDYSGNYIYATYSGALKKFYYLLSLGVEGIWMRNA